MAALYTEYRYNGPLQLRHISDLWPKMFRYNGNIGFEDLSERRMLDFK